jgi:hypothetical protein
MGDYRSRWLRQTPARKDGWIASPEDVLRILLAEIAGKTRVSSRAPHKDELPPAALCQWLNAAQAGAYANNHQVLPDSTNAPQPMKPTIMKSLPTALLAWSLTLFAPHAEAQTVSFSTAATGVTKSIPYWGYDTAWHDMNNMQRSVLFMGSGNVNLVRVGAGMHSPLIGSDIWSADISASDKSYLANLANETKSLSPNALWYFACGEYDDWYRSSTYNVYPDRYAAGWEANVRYLNTLANKPTIWAIDCFNEPDYSPNREGSAQNIYDVLWHLTNNVDCRSFKMGGLGTLNVDAALTWFNPLVPRATLGSTHWLAGTASSYVNFINTVKSRNCVACEPEVHNVGECILGANYGLDAVIWWGAAERTRGEFVQASKGKRLGYAENLPKAMAAAVYRAPNGKIKAFVGGSERTSQETTFTFTATDRDCYFNGHGPQRSYMVTSGGRNEEVVVDITWGTDPQPAINGRYKIINRNSGKALEVPASSTADGVQLQQRGYTGALNQQWDIAPLPRGDGDNSYYTIKAAHDGKAANLDAYSYANGGAINQWSYVNYAVQHWYLEYVGGGYFKIRSRWDGKVLEVSGNSTADGGLVQQWDDAGTASQQWSLQPVGVTFYADYCYMGAASTTLAPGNYTMAQLAAAGVPNDWASSVSIPAGWTVIMYQNDNFGGTSWTRTATTPNFTSLSPSGANDNMSSCRITAP